MAEFHYKYISESDISSLRELHMEWFPIRYEDSYYSYLSRETPHSLALGVYTSEGELIGAVTAIIQSPFDNNELVCEYFFEDGRKAQHNQYAAVYIQTLGVMREYRRKGIARTLVQKVIEWASEPSLPNACVFLHVIGYNQAAREFYSKIGFTELRIRQDYYYINGSYYDGHVLVLYLRGGVPPPPSFSLGITLWNLLSSVSDWTMWAVSHVTRLPPMNWIAAPYTIAVVPQNTIEEQVIEEKEEMPNITQDNIV